MGGSLEYTGRYADIGGGIGTSSFLPQLRQMISATGSVAGGGGVYLMRNTS